MNIKVTTAKVEIDNESLNKGEYNIQECNFDLAEEFTGLVCKALFTVSKTKLTYEQSIVNGKCNIPYEATVNRGKVIVGVIGYEVEDEELVKRYSPEPDEFFVLDGSYVEDIENQSTPTPSELEQLEARVSQVEIDAAQVETNTQNISDLQENKADKSELEDFITKNVDDLTYYTLTTNTGSKIDLEINSSNYQLVAKLYDKNNTLISTSNTIDLPIESMVISATYDNANKKIVLTLQNGQTLDVPVGDLVSGLQTEITNTNKLNADLVDDSTSTNKFVTASEKTTWNAKVSDTDYATSSKGGVVIASPSWGAKVTSGYLLGNTFNYSQYSGANESIFIDKGTLENVITGKQLVNETQLNTKEDKSALVTGSGENITLNNTAELEFIQPPLPKGNSEQATFILPTGYTQLDYIESTGTQYIDTGIAPDNTVEFDTTFNTSDNLSNSTYGCIFGSRQASVTNELQVTTYSDSGFQGTFRYGTGGNYNAYLTRLQKINVKLENNKYYVDDVEKLTMDKVFTNNYNIYIFALNNGGTAAQYGKLKLYKFKLWKNGSLVRSFVPCKNANNEVGLYDLVSQTFYGNSGTGTFTAGNTVTVPNPDFEVPIQNVTGDVEVLVSNSDNTEEQTFTFPLGTQRMFLGDYLADDGIHHVRKQVVLDGTETWTTQSGSHVNILNLYTSMQNWGIVAERKEVKCNIASYSTQAGANNDSTPNICAPNLAGSNFLLDLSKTTFASKSDFTTWLSTHNVTVEYEPATEEITPYTTEQQTAYNEIKQALSYNEQTNISGTSDEANPIFTVTAVQYKEPDYWTIAYVNTQIGNAIGGAY